MHPGRTAVLGSWLVSGYACGLGVREDQGAITTNTSQFVPHLFRDGAGHD
jgi:glutathionylspermidine synthase